MCEVTYVHCRASERWAFVVKVYTFLVLENDSVSLDKILIPWLGSRRAL